VTVSGIAILRTGKLSCEVKGGGCGFTHKKRRWQVPKQVSPTKKIDLPEEGSSKSPHFESVELCKEGKQ